MGVFKYADEESSDHATDYESEEESAEVAEGYDVIEKGSAKKSNSLSQPAPSRVKETPGGNESGATGPPARGF
jgi:hypothetical protein